jgi:hypothetical protein
MLDVEAKHVHKVEERQSNNFLNTKMKALAT